MEVIIGDHNRLRAVAEDFIRHYEARVAEGATVAGKAMFVCMNRYIAYDLYKIIIELRPEWAVKKVAADGVELTEKTSPSNTKNALIGAFAGFALVCGIIVLEVLMNDTIRTEDDVDKYLDLTVLAMVPARKGETAEDKEAMAKNKTAQNQKGRKI